MALVAVVDWWPVLHVAVCVSRGQERDVTTVCVGGMDDMHHACINVCARRPGQAGQDP